MLEFRDTERTKCTRCTLVQVVLLRPSTDRGQFVVSKVRAEEAERCVPTCGEFTHFSNVDALPHGLSMSCCVMRGARQTIRPTIFYIYIYIHIYLGRWCGAHCDPTLLCVKLVLNHYRNDRDPVLLITRRFESTAETNSRQDTSCLRLTGSCTTRLYFTKQTCTVVLTSALRHAVATIVAYYDRSTIIVHAACVKSD